ncbi:MAG: DNA repair protein RadC [Nanoarchaeota archaeon]|nr:DNA repair protein RadC [Nanoarchaeota archaeon]
MMNTIPLEELPREKMAQQGVDALTTSELIAILIKTGTKQGNVLKISQELASKYSLRDLSRLGLQELRQFRGIGIVKASQILSAIELGRRTVYEPERPNPKISNPEDVAFLFQHRIGNKRQEHFVALLLDSRQRIIKSKTLFIGTLNGSLIHPREIFYSAIKECADSIILVHNHPSGCSKPSKEDIRITQQLDKGAKLLGISLLDHIIIGNKEYYSMNQHNIID